MEWTSCPACGCPTLAQAEEVEAAALAIVDASDSECLAGTEVEPQPTIVFQCAPDERCLGDVVNRRTIRLGAYLTLAASAYLHELVHVLLYCRDGEGDGDHQRPEWHEVDAWHRVALIRDAGTEPCW